MHPEDVNDGDNDLEEEHQAESEVQPTLKRKREHVSTSVDTFQKYLDCMRKQKNIVMVDNNNDDDESIQNNDGDNETSGEEDDNASEVQSSRKKKREGAHGKYIYYNKKSKKYNVKVTKDGKQHYVGSFPTQEEAVVARDAFLRGETVTSKMKKWKKDSDSDSDDSRVEG